jgi:hypothetical protein
MLISICIVLWSIIYFNTSDIQKASEFSLLVWRILEFIMTRHILIHNQKSLEMRISNFTL